MGGSKQVRDMTDEEMYEAVRTGRKTFDDWARQVDSIKLVPSDWRAAAERMLAEVERLRAIVDVARAFNRGEATGLDIQEALHDAGLHEEA